MDFKIKTITLQNFKGISSKEISFDGNTTISGRNGIGKTSISDAFYFVFGNSDTALHNNPNICPIGMDEVSPRVEVLADINGKEISIAKVQKKTTKEKDGKKTVSLANSYEVNAIAYGERDFKAKMAEYGFDFDLFLPLSHPNVFTSKKADEMRKILFKMASELSDKDIAEKTEGASDVLAMMDTYSLDEISAMQKQTIRKIGEVYGKKGEILDARVDGLAMSKVDIDVAELELQRNSIKEQIAQATASINEKQSLYTDLSNRLMKLRFSLTESRNEDIAEIQKKRIDLTEKRSKALVEKGKLEGFAARLENDRKEAEEKLQQLKSKKEQLGYQYRQIKAEVMDEKATICPTCKQPFPADKIDNMKQAFEDSKEKRLADVERTGFACKGEIEGLETTIPELLNRSKQALEEVVKAKDEYERLTSEIAKLPSDSDIPKSEKTLEIEKAIAEMEQKISGLTDDDYGNKKEEITRLQMQLDEVNKKIGQADRNVQIDEQIAELQKKKIDYEQAKANAEKILYELDLISMNRNKLIENSINNHFRNVHFKLWTLYKNGEYKECCIPMVGDKELGSDMNTALEIAAKIDIVTGLQNFFNQRYPIFLDNAECLDGSQVFDLETQLILLKVTDGSFEVK